jgi:hypothetical protein
MEDPTADFSCQTGVQGNLDEEPNCINEYPGNLNQSLKTSFLFSGGLTVIW